MFGYFHKQRIPFCWSRDLLAPRRRVGHADFYRLVEKKQKIDWKKANENFFHGAWVFYKCGLKSILHWVIKNQMIFMKDGFVKRTLKNYKDTFEIVHRTRRGTTHLELWCVGSKFRNYGMWVGLQKVGTWFFDSPRALARI